MNDSKSIVVCEECSRKMRRRPHKFEEYLLYAIPVGVNCGVCKGPVLENSKAVLFNMITRRFCQVYWPMPPWSQPYTAVTI